MSDIKCCHLFHIMPLEFWQLAPSAKLCIPPPPPKKKPIYAHVMSLFEVLSAAALDWLPCDDLSLSLKQTLPAPEAMLSIHGSIRLGSFIHQLG